MFEHKFIQINSFRIILFIINLHNSLTVQHIFND